MPSHLHEAFIEMFRERPVLAAELLRQPLHGSMPDFRVANVSSGDLTDVAPTEYRADAVVTLDGDANPVLAVVVEVQLRIDPRKRQTWPGSCRRRPGGQLEEFVTTTGRRYQSEFANRYFSQGEADALLRIFNARGIDVPDDVRTRIASCTDLDQLRTWIDRASTAAKIEDLDV